MQAGQAGVMVTVYLEEGSEEVEANGLQHHVASSMEGVGVYFSLSPTEKVILPKSGSLD